MSDDIASAVSTSLPSEVPAPKQFSNISAGGHASLHLGDVLHNDVHYHQHECGPLNEQKGRPQIAGLYLGQAPVIPSEAFKGREIELKRLRELFSTSKSPRSIVSIVAMGGMGKTQLSIAYAQRYAHEYSAVFWVSARDERSVQQAFAAYGQLVDPYSRSAAVHTGDISQEQINIKSFKAWLSSNDNPNWLIIFDNYNDPKIPGLHSETGFDIRPYFGVRLQGSIILTSRSRKLTFATTFPLRKLDNVSVSVSIISSRAARDLTQDTNAVDLAKRLGGLPLALITAGTFLASNEMSCGEYQKLYESMWSELVGPDAECLYEYDDRTLLSTWTVSLESVRSKDPDVARMLEILALLSPVGIYYELIQAIATAGLPWCERLTKNKLEFGRAMSLLLNHSLIDIADGIYELHPCLHDWLVCCFTIPPDDDVFKATIRGVAALAQEYMRFGCQWQGLQRVGGHADRLCDPQHKNLWRKFAGDKMSRSAAYSLALVQAGFRNLDVAERMFLYLLEEDSIPDYPVSLAYSHVCQTLMEDEKRARVPEALIDGLKKTCSVEIRIRYAAMVQLSDTYVECGRFDKAEFWILQSLEQSLSIACSAEQRVGYRAQSLQKLGRIYFMMEKYSDAQFHLNAAIHEREHITHTNWINLHGIEAALLLSLACFKQEKH